MTNNMTAYNELVNKQIELKESLLSKFREIRDNFKATEVVLEVLTNDMRETHVKAYPFKMNHRGIFAVSFGIVNEGIEAPMFFVKRDKDGCNSLVWSRTLTIDTLMDALYIASSNGYIK